MGEREVVFRDGKPLAVTDDGRRWLLKHQPMSPDWAIRHEGYRINNELEVRLCATCLGLVESGQAVGVLVRGKDKENPITVHKHPGCPHPPRDYRTDPRAMVRELLAELEGKGQGR